MPVDVIYRRIDDDFLDPTVFRPDSMLGVPGLIQPTAPAMSPSPTPIGTGVADDKVMYAYVPRLIKYYLGQDAHPPNVNTYLASEPNPTGSTSSKTSSKLVVKAANEAGGYGMLIGPRRRRPRCEKFRGQGRRQPPQLHRPADDPIMLSRSPTWCDGRLEGRHIDLRPYILYGEKSPSSSPAASPASPSAKARSWSTPPKAAARRTPGSSRATT
jgi:uncharacterized circularly permuted ATP-grasp superfamily protein